MMPAWMESLRHRRGATPLTSIVGVSEANDAHRDVLSSEAAPSSWCLMYLYCSLVLSLLLSDCPRDGGGGTALSVR